MKLSFACQALVFYGSRFPNHPGKWWVHNKLRSMLGASVAGEVDVTRAGFHWRLRPADYTQAKLFWLGGMDRWELFHIQRRLPAEAVICDIGANFGYYSVVLGARLTEGHVHAFEPNPPTFQRLQQSIRLNGLEQRISTYPLALSDHIGTIQLVDARADNAGAAYVSEEAEGVTVQLTTLDEFAKQHALTRLDFMKLDVEGNEERVIRGGLRTLQTYRPVILIEIHPVLLRRMGSSAEAILSALRDLGYRLYSIQRKQLVLLTGIPTDLTNALCLPDSKPA